MKRYNAEIFWLDENGSKGVLVARWDFGEDLIDRTRRMARSLVIDALLQNYRRGIEGAGLIVADDMGREVFTYMHHVQHGVTILRALLATEMGSPEKSDRGQKIRNSNDGTRPPTCGTAVSTHG